jgi:cytochrome b561
MAKLLHWTIAALFAASYVSIYYRHWFTGERSESWLLSGQVHRCVGISIGAFVVLRIAWRFYSAPPQLPSGPRWERLAARSAHYALYFFMIMMPLTGYLGTDAPTGVGWLAVPNFADTQFFAWLSGGVVGFDEWERPLDFFHRRIGGALLVWILILIHVSAALYHHFGKNDAVLARMLPMAGGNGAETGPGPRG